MKVYYPRAEALAVARELCEILKPVTERILVAGSLRRRKDLVGDVEILFIPKEGMMPDPSSLFGEPVQTNLAELAFATLLKDGRLSKRPNKDGGTAWGLKNKLAVHEASGIPVDLFTADEENWACLSVCRTGSAASNERICNAAIARGLKWAPYGLGFLDRRTDDLVIRCRTEQEVFNAVGLAYREPWERNE